MDNGAYTDAFGPCSCENPCADPLKSVAVRLISKIARSPFVAIPATVLIVILTRLAVLVGVIDAVKLVSTRVVLVVVVAVVFVANTGACLKIFCSYRTASPLAVAAARLVTLLPFKLASAENVWITFENTPVAFISKTAFVPATSSNVLPAPEV